MITTFTFKFMVLVIVVLTMAADNALEGRALMSTRRTSRSTVARKVWENKKQYLWPNGVVPVVINYSVSHKQSFINKAFNFYHQNTCIRFVQRTFETDYVNISRTSDGKCKSHVGRIGGEQFVYLSSDYCFMGANVQHELLHTLGFLHEHVRPDRNQYIELNYEKILKVERYEYVMENFDINMTEAVTLSPYDYVSIMHYGWKWVRQVKKKGAVIFDPANNFGLSELDLKHLKELYNCPENAENET